MVGGKRQARAIPSSSSPFSKYLLRLYLILLGLPVLLISIVVVRCAHYPLLLKFSNLLVKFPRVVPARESFLQINAREAVLAIDQLIKGAFFLQITCLERSIALRFLLAQVCIPSRIRLGVQRRNNTFLAHAWVETDIDLLSDNSNQPDSEIYNSQPNFREAFFAFPETPF